MNIDDDGSAAIEDEEFGAEGDGSGFADIDEDGDGITVSEDDGD